jgi:hypothetical protein
MIALDARHAGIVGEAGEAVQRTVPHVALRRYMPKEGERDSRPRRDHYLARGVSPAWTRAQAQPHDRAGRLQREITTAHPRELLRGLIHSDGCRTMNRFKTKLPSGRVAAYEYSRYFFSNLSEDIRGIFCEHCELLGIRWTQSNPRNISISRRKSVALMDEFIGPKA